MRMLICGGGVIGAATAYFLARRGIAATVIERTGIACAASGKSGGFLALDWCDGTPLAPLARRSFALHAQLAQEIPGDWGYRRVTTLGGVALGSRSQARADATRAWLSPTVAVTQQTGLGRDHRAGPPGALYRIADAGSAERRRRGAARAGREYRHPGRDDCGRGRRRRDCHRRCARRRDGAVVAVRQPIGCRCRRSTDGKATAWCSRRAAPFRRKRYSATTASCAMACSSPNCFRVPTVRPTSARFRAKARCRSTRGGRARSGCDRTARSDLPRPFPRASRGADRRAPGLFPAGVP